MLKLWCIHILFQIKSYLQESNLQAVSESSKYQLKVDDSKLATLSNMNCEKTYQLLELK